MPARLAVYLPRQPMRQVFLEPDKSYLIGRAEDCDLHYHDARLSRRHARLSHHDGAWFITDLDSKNGTLLNGRPVKTERIRPGSLISLGGLIAGYEELTAERYASEQTRERILRETTRELRQSLDPRLGFEALLSRVLDSVLELSGLERGFVLLADDEGAMKLAATRGLSDQELKDNEFTGSWGAIRTSLANRRTMVSGDVESVTGLGERPSVVQRGIRALACVPLSVAEKVTGLVYADSTKPGRQFTQLDLELLEALCNQAAVAIGAARLERELSSLRLQLPEEGRLDERLSQLMRKRLSEYRPVESDVELARSALAGGDS